MSWLFSQALVEEYSQDICSDGELSVQSSGSPTQLAYCALDKMTKFSRLSRFGMTFKPLTENRGEELLMSYLEDFRARTSVPQEKAQESPEKEVGCGEKWHALLGKYDRNTRSWKIAQCSLFEDLELSLETWPRWGLMRNGECWERTPLERLTKETVFGFYVPTLTSSDGTSGAVIGKNDQFYQTKDGKPRKINQKGNDGTIGLGRLVQMWPTPCLPGNGGTNGKAKMKKMLAENWPTPRSFSAMAATITPESAWNEKRKSNLETIVGQRLWPTPIASRGGAWRSDGQVAMVAKNVATYEEYLLLTQGTSKKKREKYWPAPQALDNLNMGSVDLTSGQLNPTWVEWLMGWPLGWTDLKPLEMDKSHCVQQQPGES